MGWSIGLRSLSDSTLGIVVAMTDTLQERDRVAHEAAVGKPGDSEAPLQVRSGVDENEPAHQTDNGLRDDLTIQDRSSAVRLAAAKRVRHAAAATGTSVKAAKDAAGTAVRAGVARAAGDVAAATAVAAEKGGALFHSGASGVAAGFGVASNTMAGFAENLDWTTIDPTKYLYAGTRGISRGFEEAQLVWESIPAQLRALGPEEVAKKLDGFDWSHIVPRSEEGSDGAANGIFELASLNRSRGAEQMTAAEVQAAAEVLSQTAFRAAVQHVASKALAGAVAGAAVACVLACLEESLAYQRGEITTNEMYARIGRAVAKASALGAAVSGLMAAVALAFPALIPLVAPLMLPLAVLGLCAVGGKFVCLGKGVVRTLSGGLRPSAHRRTSSHGSASFRNVSFGVGSDLPRAAAGRVEARTASPV